MANRFWVGGTGSWTQVNTANWSATNGGAGGASVPTAADDVFFTSLSGAGTCTITVAGPCRSLQSTVSSVNFTHNSGVTITIGDATAGASNIALDLSGFTTYTRGSTTSSAFSFVSTSATTQTIKFHATGPGNITWNGVGGSWQMLNGYTQTASVWTHTAGTVDWNGQTFSVSSMSSSGSGVRTMTFGAANITFSSTGTTWNTATNTNLTISPNTSIMNFTNATTLSPGTNTNFNGASWVVTTNATTAIATGNSIWGNLTLASTGLVGTITLGNTTYTGTLTMGGASTRGVNRLSITGGTFGTQRTINGPAIVINGDVIIRDMTFTGSPTWTNSGNAYVGDCQGNDSVVTSNATTSVAQTWNGTSGGNWSANAWTTRMPLPQDDVTINAAFAASQTITLDVLHLGRNLDFTGVTGSPTITPTAGYTVYGSVTLTAGITWNLGSSVAMTLGDRRGGSTFTSAGQLIAPLNANCFGGSYTQLDALSISSGGSGTFTVNGGTWNTNGFTLNARWSVTVAAGATFNQGASTVNLGQVGLGTAAATPWSLSTTSNYSWAIGASINIVQTITTTRTFAGGNDSYPPLNYTVAGSTGGLTITGSNRFAALNVTDASNGRTITFSASSVNAFDSWGVYGTAGNLMSVVSAVGGTQNFLAGRAFTDPYGNSVYVSGQTISGGALNATSAASNYAFSPYTPSVGITGDLDIRAYVNPTSWTVASTSILVGREQSSSTLSFALALQTLKRVTLRLSQTGSTTVASLSTAVPFADGTAAWIRATYLQSTGQIQFFYSLDGPSVTEPNWTLLNTTTTTVTFIADLGSQVEIGTRLNGTNSSVTGQIYRAVIKSGISGTTVYDADFSSTINNFVSNYLSLQDSNAAGPKWYAGAGSTNVSNNTGWIFTNATIAITKTLQYAVKATPNAISKALTYNVRRTPSALTKSLQYTLKTTPSFITKALAYALKLPTHPDRNATYLSDSDGVTSLNAYDNVIEPLDSNNITNLDAYDNTVELSDISNTTILN